MKVKVKFLSFLAKSFLRKTIPFSCYSTMGPGDQDATIMDLRNSRDQLKALLDLPCTYSASELSIQIMPVCLYHCAVIKQHMCCLNCTNTSYVNPSKKCSMPPPTRGYFASKITRAISARLLQLHLPRNIPPTRKCWFLYMKKSQSRSLVERCQINLDPEMREKRSGTT